MWLNLRSTLGSLLLILLCPPFQRSPSEPPNTALGGSLGDLWSLMTQQGIFQLVYTIWKPYFLGSAIAWGVISCFVVLEIILMCLLPGKTVYGPISPKGNIPVYKSNGILAFLITIMGFCIATFGLRLFPATILYDNLGFILCALNIFSLIFCVLLYIKGRFFPSSTDASTSNNILFDYYWGTELYPQVFGWSVKKFITCRFGMMSWGLLLISYAAKQEALGGLANSMMISVGLQLLYITKFYIWENGYLRSLDIMHDRAGFYIC